MEALLGVREEKERGKRREGVEREEKWGLRRGYLERIAEVVEMQRGLNKQVIVAAIAVCKDFR